MEYQIPDQLDERLKNWARFAKVRKFPSACRSIEHRYRPEAGETWEPAPVRVSVDLLDAWKVEAAWSKHLAMKPKMLLKAHYITQPSVPKADLKSAFMAYLRRISRTLGIPQSRYSMELYRAALTLEGHLSD